MANYTTWADKTVYDKDDNEVGTIDALYLDDSSDEPTWATVKSPTFFGSKMHFAPVTRAQEIEDGVRLNVTEDQIKSAPSVDVDSELSEDDETLLYQHYTGGRDSAADDYADDDDTTGHDTSGPDTDEAMTRSEEQLHVGKETQAIGRARLRKYIVTEDVHTTVPVSREEVRLEREPITGTNRGQALAGADLTEEEHEMTLNAERVVVSKETVPVERVKMSKNIVTEEVDVDESVQKEQIELDDRNNDQNRNS